MFEGLYDEVFSSDIVFDIVSGTTLDVQSKHAEPSDRKSTLKKSPKL